jgi:uracil phosphoribosyltransferase
MVIDLSKNNSLLNHWVAELRDVHVQNDRMRFRRNIERIGEVAAYELSKTLQADNAFISAYRKHHPDGSFEISLEYLSCPNLNDRVLILCDPMLATGASLVETIQAIQKTYTPAQIHIVVTIASQKGIEHVEKELGADTPIWCAAIDPILNDKSYIVPGLGDSGDLAFGTKMQS